MNLPRLVIQEIRFRKLSFVLGMAAVVAATACLVAVTTLLRGHELQIAEMNADREQDTAARMVKVQDDYRKITKNMGYNLLILARDQDLDEFFAQGYASSRIPEQYVERLANSKIMTVQHLLPSLYKRVSWPEQGNRTVVLMGIRGEVPLAHRDPKTPILDPVSPGTMKIGYVLHETLGLNVGDTVRFTDKEFEITEVHPKRGNLDDITVWVHLEDAQEMLGERGKINTIMALNCMCYGGDMDKTREDIERILPDTQVVQLAPQAVARALARNRASALTDEVTSQELAYHASLRQMREALAAWLVPLVLAGCAAWIGLLAWSNVRERTGEIGILRAIGLRSGQIMGVFLAKAFLMGLAGAIVGFGAGFVMGTVWAASERVPVGPASVAALFDPVLLLGVIACAPLLACTATWIPAILAAQHDPATVLREN